MYIHRERLQKVPSQADFRAAQEIERERWRSKCNYGAGAGMARIVGCEKKMDRKTASE